MHYKERQTVGDLNTVDEILDFAVKEEEKAYEFYVEMAEKVNRKQMQLVFRDLAKEEVGHKAKLLAIKKNKQLIEEPGQKGCLKISDYSIPGAESSVDVKDAEMDIQKAYLLAMKKEKAAFQLYTHLAELIEDEESRKILSAIAQEEAKHRQRLENDYDEHFLSEN